MLLPRVDTTQSLQPTPLPTSSSLSSNANHTSYNVITIAISVIAGVFVLTCFYLFYWRKRPEPHHKPQLCVSRTGAARLRVGGPERWRIIERAQREQEARDRCAADWSARRKEEAARNAMTLPKYSRSTPPGDVRADELEIVEVHNQAPISIPPPAYDQTTPRPLFESRSRS